MSKHLDFLTKGERRIRIIWLILNFVPLIGCLWFFIALFLGKEADLPLLEAFFSFILFFCAYVSPGTKLLLFYLFCSPLYILAVLYDAFIKTRELPWFFSLTGICITATISSLVVYFDYRMYQINLKIITESMAKDPLYISHMEQLKAATSVDMLNETFSRLYKKSPRMLKKALNFEYVRLKKQLP